MENRKNKIRLLLQIALALVVVYFVVAYFCPWLPSPYTPTSKAEKIEHWISHDKVQALFKQERATYLMLEIYPIKHSAGADKNDFDLAVFFRDTTGRFVDKEMDEDFENRSGNYLSYLKSTNHGDQKVPLGYQVYLSETTLGQNKNLIVTLQLATLQSTLRSDSCRYPPGCTAIFMEQPIKQVYAPVAFSDSCRTPPGCPRTLLNNDMMQKLMQEHFNAARQEKK